MTTKRNYYRYKLNQWRNIVYYGITNDPERRENEHISEGKNFSKMRIVGPVVKKGTAINWEEEKIDNYKGNHRGRRPKYNDLG